ncbi:MAG: putative sulfate exporter family transporter, partial [Deltaproteobacteria bacterium]|nr:putative sulfate exporter family transporter [Deltaproteobacteria bacterium]
NHQPVFGILNSNFVWNPLLLGLIIGNAFGVPDTWKPGLSYIHMLMPLGIIMLAPHFMLWHATKLGVVPIAIIVASLFFTATATLLIAKWFKLDDRHGSIIAGGLSTGDPHVCAILMPLIKAKGGQVVNALVCVLVFGLVAMMALPYLGAWLDIPQSCFGLASVVGVGNGHQALSAAFARGYEAGRYALWYDIGRHVIMPAGFIYVFIVMFIRKLRYRNDPSVKATGHLNSFPLWLGVFIFFWILTTLHVFKEPAHHAIFNMVKWDFSLAASALGLSLSFKDIARPGLKGLAVTFVAGSLRIAVLLAALVVCIKTGLLPVAP